MKHLQLTEELQESASFYAAGAMSEEERKRYARHLEEDGCDVCRTEVQALQAAIHSLALALPEQSPAPTAKMRLMAQAELSVSRRGLESPRPSRGTEWLAWLISAAATTALIAIVAVNSNLRKSVNLLTARVAQLESQMVGQRTTLAALTSPRFRVIDLAGQGTTPGAAARIFWNEREKRSLFYVSALPPASQQRTYQLWFVPKKGAPISASVFNTNSDGSAMTEIEVPGNIGDLKATAVTTEPAGGVPQPTGSFVLLGSL
jgi:anti-sigma-K factor RskA